MKTTRIQVLSAALLLALAGCTGTGSSSSTPASGAATNIVVTLTPMAAQVGPGGSATFIASVTGTSDAGVVWSVQEGAAGGTVSPSGVYVAPPTTGTYHLVAASRADPTKIQVATVTVVETSGAGTVTITPAAVTLDACGSVAFSAAAGGGTPALVWQVREGQSGGTITPAGAYTAPQTPGTYHVVASSAANPGQSAEAVVVVGAEKVLSVAVTPGSASLTPSGAVAFAAIVTTSCGSFAAQ